eukprot:1693036-Rhodomonas_salina.1
MMTPLRSSSCCRLRSTAYCPPPSHTSRDTQGGGHPREAYPLLLSSPYSHSSSPPPIHTPPLLLALNRVSRSGLATHVSVSRSTVHC